MSTARYTPASAPAGAPEERAPKSVEDAGGVYDESMIRLVVSLVMGSEEQKAEALAARDEALRKLRRAINSVAVDSSQPTPTDKRALVAEAHAHKPTPAALREWAESRSVARLYARVGEDGAEWTVGYLLRRIADAMEGR